MGILFYVLVGKNGEKRKSMPTKYAKYGNTKCCKEVNIWLSDF